MVHGINYRDQSVCKRGGGSLVRILILAVYFTYEELEIRKKGLYTSIWKYFWFLSKQLSYSSIPDHKMFKISEIRYKFFETKKKEDNL